MDKMSGAELRADLWGLGFSVPAFAIYGERDLRTTKRAVQGISERVSLTMIEQVKNLQAEADLHLTEWDKLTEEGAVILLPRLNQKQNPGKLPPQWWIALAARHRKKWGSKAHFEWEPKTDQK